MEKKLRLVFSRDMYGKNIQGSHYYFTSIEDYEKEYKSSYPLQYHCSGRGYRYLYNTETGQYQNVHLL